MAHLTMQENDMHLFEESALLHEVDVMESRRFLIGLGNGIWMSAALTLGVYWFLQILL
jgi:hypothetical protein